MGRAQVVHAELTYAEEPNGILQPTSPLPCQPLSRPDFPGHDADSPRCRPLPRCAHSWQRSARAPDVRREVGRPLTDGNSVCIFPGSKTRLQLVRCLHEIKGSSALPVTSPATCWWPLQGQGWRWQQELSASLPSSLWEPVTAYR